MINVIINGKLFQIKEGISIVDYLNDIQLDLKFIAIAHNGEIVAKDNYCRTNLNDGDKLEIVKPVGGG